MPLFLTLRRMAGVVLRRLGALKPLPPEPVSAFGGAKFDARPPNVKNAIELFDGHWAADLSRLNPEWRGGTVNLVTDDRPDHAARLLGAGGRLDGMSVLELGPLEAMHTIRLEQLGASSILAIESNTEAYLKCLVMKETFGVKAARFLLGDSPPIWGRPMRASTWCSAPVCSIT